MKSLVYQSRGKYNSLAHEARISLQPPIEATVKCQLYVFAEGPPIKLGSIHNLFPWFSHLVFSSAFCFHSDSTWYFHYDSIWGFHSDLTWYFHFYLTWCFCFLICLSCLLCATDCVVRLTAFSDFSVCSDFFLMLHGAF